MWTPYPHTALAFGSAVRCCRCWSWRCGTSWGFLSSSPTSLWRRPPRIGLTLVSSAPRIYLERGTSEALLMRVDVPGVKEVLWIEVLEASMSIFFNIIFWLFFISSIFSFISLSLSSFFSCFSCNSLYCALGLLVQRPLHCDTLMSWQEILLCQIGDIFIAGIFTTKMYGGLWPPTSYSCVGLGGPLGPLSSGGIQIRLEWPWTGKSWGSQCFIKGPNWFDQQKWVKWFLKFLGTPKTPFMVFFVCFFSKCSLPIDLLILRIFFSQNKSLTFDQSMYGVYF